MPASRWRSCGGGRDLWGNVSGAHGPAQAMSLDLQAQNLDSNYPSGPTENMTVDWVAEYTPAG